MQMIGWARLGMIFVSQVPELWSRDAPGPRVGAGAALLAPGDDDKMAHFCQLRTERLRSPPPCTLLLHTTAVWGPAVLHRLLQAGQAGTADTLDQDTAKLAGTGHGAWRHRGADTWKPSPLQTQRNVSSEALYFTGRNIATSVTSDWGHSLGEKHQAD